MPTSAQESIRSLIELLKTEKEEDYRQYQQKVLGTTIVERRKKGITWYPVQIANQYISTGERITIEVERTNDVEQQHSFQVGAVVSVFVGSDASARTITGVISYLRKSKMKVALNTSDFPTWFGEGKVGVNLLFDESTYRAMESALKTVEEAEQGRLATLREIIYGNALPRVENGHEYRSPYLNEQQNKALTTVFNARDIAIIHGPPGTGKTTTLVHIIKDTVRTEKQVLVCAQSNAALDLLVEKLAVTGVQVLRLGHPARLSPEVIENSLDVRISQHASFKELKEVRKDAEKLKKIALTYKRNFGRQEREQRNRVLNEARMLKDHADKVEAYITESLLLGAQVIATTLTGANHYLLQDRMFKTVFIDEASQALEPACWIPIIKSQRVVMAGDHCQLPPTVKSRQAAKGGLERTLFEKCRQKEGSAIMLELQYRMHPNIMKFSSQYFYNNRLKTAQDVLDRETYNEDIPFVFIDTAGCSYREKVDAETRSTYNTEEAKLLFRHLKQYPQEGKSIGIIAPYKAQIKLLRAMLTEEEGLDTMVEHITINTVDAFQGQERDVMYISLVRSNDKCEIGFLKEYRRMNVAMTRAKSKLVVIGDSATLGEDAFYSAVLDHVQALGGYRSAFEFEEY